ncbi:MAG: ribonuclease P protein component [Planctomycetes bacterium]|nr:ribonuclease P protein component [Planctomycetota bacterium]
MDQRLLRRERIGRQAEIDACYRQGVRLVGKILRFHVRRSDRAFARMAISVPRRFVRKAVERNRWKRLLREAFRRNKAAIGPGLDIVAVPMRPPGDLKRADVESAMLSLLSRKP